VTLAGDGFAIRAAVAEDHESCARILTESWISALPHRPREVGLIEFREQTDGELLFVSANERGIAGFISVWAQEWFVHHLFVDPVFQNRGVGTGLLEHVAMLAGEGALTLKCQAENQDAIRFYARFGFTPTGLRGHDEFGEWVQLRGRPC
jgi:ribosomal protein S18 acetylase RimI-like enzyme